MRAIPRALFVLAILFLPLPSFSQYIYLDSNGDGIHDASDSLASSGTTRVDVWLVTNQRADGTPASCGTGPEELTINSYEFLLHAICGAVTFSGYESHFPANPVYAVVDTSTGDFYAGWGDAQIMPAGKYRLASLSMTATSGTPAVLFLGNSPAGGTFETAFGSRCIGLDSDNTLKLRTDWFDAGGIGPADYRPGVPVITPIPDVLVELGTGDSLDVTSTDWDDDPISVRLVDPPDFVSLKTLSSRNGLVRSRVLIRGTRVGTYPVVVGASDASAEGRDTFLVTIEDLGVFHAPRFEPMTNLTVDQGQRAIETLVATDADGGDLRIELVRAPRYVALGAARSSPGRIERALFANPNGKDVSGTVVVRCTDTYLEVLDSLQVIVNDVDFAPQFVSRPAQAYCAAQTEYTWIEFGSVDADGDSLILTTEGLPPWANAEFGYSTVIPTWGGVVLHLRPQATDSVGSYPVRLRLDDPTGRFAEVATTLVLGPPGSCVDGGDPGVCMWCASAPFPPVADVGGPYRGVAGVPIQFDGRQSHSDGSAVHYRWDFGDGTNASGPYPAHTYSRGGEFRVFLNVSNPGGTSRDSALVPVAGGYAVRAFTLPANRPVVGVASNERVRLYLEAAESLYAAPDIDPTSIVIARTGVSGEAHVLADKGSRVGDSDRNGVPDLEVALSGGALRSLMVSEAGKSQVELSVDGRLQSGAHIVGSLALGVIGMPGPSRRAVLWPNPMNPAGVLAFEVRRRGPVGVRIYDAGGRLVRTLVDADLPVGPVTVPFDGRDARGRDLAAGIYFYRIESSDGREVGRIAILK
jgi:hypothetical protein